MHAVSIAELATATGVHPPSLYRLMRALASIGVFAEDKSGRFVLTPMAGALLSDAPQSIRAIAIMTGEDWWWRAWGQVHFSVQTGKSSFEHVHGMRFFDYMTDQAAGVPQSGRRGGDRADLSAHRAVRHDKAKWN